MRVSHASIMRSFRSCFSTCPSRQISRTMVRLLSVLFLGAYLTVDTTQGFNFDTRAPLVFNGPSGSLFGFSVSQHRDGGTDWALVGAPEAATNQPNVVNGGAVYKCPVAPLSNPGSCEQVPFDTTGDTEVTDKSNQWFGATLESSGPNGRILACAPRLVWFKDATLAEKEREPTGTCFVGFSNFTNFVEYSPCQTQDEGQFGFDKITHCQAGMSAQIPRDNDVLVMGAPGSFYLQGQIFVQDLADPDTRISTPEAAVDFDNSYRGFSLALGDFNGDGREDFVVGTPRGQSLLGMVSIFDSSLKSLENVTGEQLVSYFGNSVEAVDLNGDGRDDLVVGAPMHTDKRSAIEKWEAGRVYVYYQDADHSLGNTRYLTGPVIRARFGYSVSSIGDSNQDGYNDIAIGAPFAGEGQTGLVYIYHGSANGLSAEPAQVLSPTDLGQTGVTTFGFSLQGGQDMDGNSYPDLLIGAESADMALLVRTRPVVSLRATLTLDPIGINLDNKTYELPDGTMVTSFVANACFQFSGNHLPDSIAISYTLTLDPHVTGSPRALLVDDNSNRIQKQRNLNKDNEFCDSLRAYVVNTIQDKLTPIEVTLQYELNQDESSLQHYEILPIMDMQAVSSKTKQVYIQNNCADNICIPELGVQATLNRDEIVIGGTTEVTLDVTLVNAGEDAFQSTLSVYYPEGMQFVRLERTAQNDLSVNCAEDSDLHIITCETGNPLVGRHTLDFGLTLSTLQISGDRQNIEFYLIAKSENNEQPDMLMNNEQNITVAVTVDIGLKLLSASDPEILSYPVSEEEFLGPFPTTNASESDIGPPIMHLYEIRNSGPSMAGMTEMEIRWPQKNEGGEYLFYLLGLSTADGITCEITQGEANPLEVRLDPETKKKLAGAPSETRRRREANAAEAEALAQTDQYYCADEGCVVIRCELSQLEATESKVVRLFGRFWIRTFMKPELTAGTKRFSVASSAMAEVMDVPYNIPLPRGFKDSTKASTSIIPEELQPTTQGIAWWIIVVSVLGGIILLLLIILGLWKCGFFERKTPGGEEQKTPYTSVPCEETGAEGEPTDV